MNEVYEMTGVQESKDTWQTREEDGQWAGQSAGGCRNFLKSFPNNPQYLLSLPSKDPQSRDNLCTCIFAILQKFRREQRFKGLDMMPIGFSVYKVDGNEGRLSSDYIGSNKACARSPIFINLREVCGRFRLPPGNYVVIPSTYEPGQEGAFMARFFSHAGIDVQAV